MIVLRGEGPDAFCSGGDQRIRGDDGYIGDDAVAERGIGRLNVLDLQVLIRRIPKPVIASVAGYAIGGGHVLHLVCDLTIAADNARFGQTGPMVGSFDGGYGSGLLARTIGLKRAKEIWFLCRQYDAAQAEAWGLVNTVVPLDDLEAETVAWCRRILALSPIALRMLKAGFNAADDGLAGIQQLAGDATMLFYMTEEGQEGRNAYVERRPPDFSRFPAAAVTALPAGGPACRRHPAGSGAGSSGPGRAPSPSAVSPVVRRHGDRALVDRGRRVLVAGGAARWSWPSPSRSGPTTPTTTPTACGAPTRPRVGPLRLVASGLASPRAVGTAAIASLRASPAVAGLALAAATTWWLVPVGAASVAAGWLYTGGPKPYGYLGLGEPFVFVFFGLVATVGSAYVQVGRVTPVSVRRRAARSASSTTALLEANNLRDREGDAAAGKRTLAVRLGAARAPWLYVGAIGAGALGVAGLAAWRPVGPDRAGRVRAGRGAGAPGARRRRGPGAPSGARRHRPDPDRPRRAARRRDPAVRSGASGGRNLGRGQPRLDDAGAQRRLVEVGGVRGTRTTAEKTPPVERGQAEPGRHEPGIVGPRQRQHREVERRPGGPTAAPGCRSPARRRLEASPAGVLRRRSAISAASAGRAAEHRLGQPAAQEPVEVTARLRARRPERRRGARRCSRAATSSMPAVPPIRIRRRTRSWVRQRGMQRDPGPEGVAEQVGRLGPGFGGRSSTSAAGALEIHLDRGRVAVAGQVDLYQPVVLRQRVAESAPEAAGLGEPVGQHDRRSGAHDLGVQGGHER